MAQAYFCRTITLLLTALGAILPAYLVFAPITASALDTSVQPRINTGAMYYKLDVEDTFAVDDTMPFVGGGATAFIDRFYVDLYAQGAFSGNDDLQQIQGTTLSRAVTIDWDRAEYSASVGYSVTDNWSVFAGYRRSDMEFDFSDTNTTFFDYENDGPFVGATYGLPIKINEWLDGTLAVNAAVARFDGEITFAPETQAPDVTGDTVGFTGGVTWIGNLLEGTGSGFFANGLNYTFGVDGYSYDFDQDNVPEGVSGNEISETVVRGSVGLSVPFNL
jgi:hypothetical protein